MKAGVQTCSRTRVFKTSLNSLSLSLCTTTDDCGMSHSSDSIPLPHHCSFFWFSCPLSIFSELSCKTNAISSLIFERSFSEVILSQSRLGTGCSFLQGIWRKAGRKRNTSLGYHARGMQTTFTHKKLFCICLRFLRAANKATAHLPSYKLCL